MNAPRPPPTAFEVAWRADAAASGVPAIDIRALTHAYTDGPTALSGVDLHIEAGEAVAIVGATAPASPPCSTTSTACLLPAAAACASAKCP